MSYVCDGNIEFNIGGTKAFTIERVNSNTKTILHNYETLPAGVDTYVAGSVMLDGSAVVIAHNTPKAFCTITDGGTTPVLSNAYGVSAITRTSTGVYDLEFNSGVFNYPGASFYVPTFSNMTAGVRLGTFVNNTNAGVTLTTYNSSSSKADTTSFSVFIL